MIPRLNPREDSKPLDEIAVAFLRHRGLEPQFYQDEESARASVSRDLLANRYPLLLTNLDTEGEKPSETFADQENKSWTLACPAFSPSAIVLSPRNRCIAFCA
jgi:hypothetical protein